MDMNTANLPKKGLKKYDYNIDMDKTYLEKLTKEQLIELLLKQEKKKPKVVIVDDTKPTRPTPPPRTGKWENVKPKPVPRKSVKQMVKEYEDHIIQPPEQFRDGYKPIPKPRTDERSPLQMRRYPKPTRKAPPLPITQVEDHIIQPPEQFRDGYKPLQMRRPPKPTRKPPPPPITVPKIKELNKAIKGHAKSYGIELQDDSKPLNHFTKTKELVESHLENLLKDMRGSNSLKHWR